MTKDIKKDKNGKNKKATVCTECGQELAKGAVACENCGKEFEHEDKEKDIDPHAVVEDDEIDLEGWDEDEEDIPEADSDDDGVFN